MRENLKTLSGVALIVAAIYAYSWFASNGKREIARAFLTEVSSGEFTLARDRLNSTLSQEWTEARFASQFSKIAPFTNISLNLIGSKKRSSTMNLTGSAETGSGCVSTVFVSFDVWYEYYGGGEIEDFDIDPLCFE